MKSNISILLHLIFVFKKFRLSQGQIAIFNNIYYFYVNSL